MTRIQHAYFQVIKEFITKRGFSPSYAEIGELMGGRSLATVSNAVKKLIADGYLSKGPQINRSIEIVPAKMHGLAFCDRQHERVWYMSASCPMCRLLGVLRSSGGDEMNKLSKGDFR